ncbi:MAG: ArsR family transcriptional regulator [Chloroflexi bacterium]|nr:MAG: ArsR family transcriptional regulator [Chloroflexota bacterium]
MMEPRLEAEINRLHAAVCSALSDPKRISILYALYDGPKNVTELTELLGLNQATTSRHLKILRDRSLVEAERRGVHIYYSLADERVIQALDLLREVLASTLEQRKTLAELMA